MSGPPAELSPDKLWLALTEIPRPSKLVDLPRNDPTTGQSIGQVRMRVLSQKEQMAALAAAEEFTKKALKDPPKKDQENLGYENLYNNASSIELLFRACRRAEEDHPFFPSPGQMREHLTQDEVGILLRSYIHVQNELGPIVSHLTEGEIEAWIKKLVEGGSAFPLALLSSEAMTELVMHMASRLYSSSMATSLRGSQPEDSTTKTESDS